MATWPRWEGDAKAGVKEMIEVSIVYRNLKAVIRRANL